MCLKMSISPGLIFGIFRYSNNTMVVLESTIQCEYGKDKAINIDEALTLLGGFGTFQILINIIIPLASTLEAIQNLSIVFVAKDPLWICTTNSTICNITGVQLGTNNLYCSMPSGEWKYVNPDDSIISQFRLDCKHMWMQQLPPSMFHAGSIIGLLTFGWLSDRFGRKIDCLPVYIQVIRCRQPRAVARNEMSEH